MVDNHKERQEDRDKEVEAAVKEVEQRLEQQGKVNKQLTKELKSLIRDMELLKPVVADQQTFPALPKPNSDQSAKVEASDVWDVQVMVGL